MVEQKGVHFVCNLCKYKYAAKEQAESCEDNCRSGTFDPELEGWGIPPEQEQALNWDCSISNHENKK